MSGSAWACAGALTLVAAALVAVRWAAGALLPGLPPLPCDLPAPAYVAVLVGFAGGQVAADLPLRLGPGHFALLCGPLLITAAACGAQQRRPDLVWAPLLTTAVALVVGFLVVGLTV
ncbi:hypothetical protein [Streptomyces antimicrobicus]|uniref:Uncharacterized protein n=1 Tax=Streptomyces antimicrobicus TaxID=2883108 RepID=A0ABS8BE23_9ACTN|nr:hypothetical protein [Streptomyces antimicrobicus]MCB5182878.1 hypothetical protein [Streptomyces antimicrobicus]